VRIERQLVFNGAAQMLNAAPAGFRLAYVPEDSHRPTSPRTVWSECSAIGARRFLAIISITRVPPSPPAFALIV